MSKIKRKNVRKLLLFFWCDEINQLGEKSINKSSDNLQIISPPIKLTFNYFSLLSYSVNNYHSVLITSDFSLKWIGLNEDGWITSTLQKTSIDHFIDFSIKDGSGQHLNPISAVCSDNGTLYMFSKKNDNKRKLVICDCEINWGGPVSLDIGNHYPVALLGGCSHSTSICSESEIIFINRDSVKKLPETQIESISLPGGEKASSVACCE